jgi:hypothetical protein
MFQSTWTGGLVVNSCWLVWIFLGDNSVADSQYRQEFSNIWCSWLQSEEMTKQIQMADYITIVGMRPFAKCNYQVGMDFTIQLVIVMAIVEHSP